MSIFHAARRSASTGALLLASSALFAPAFAHAAEAAPDVAAPDAAAAAESFDTAAEITVTARHRDEKLQNVPIAISAVSGAELTTKRLERVADFAIKVPNFNAVQQNTRVSGLNIRGLGGNASNDGAEGGVGLIVDGVFFTHVGFSWLDFVDLQDIQVVRGPQGTLLGKNTTIGAVIVQTQKPSFDPSLTISATYANRDAAQLRINATGPLIEDKLAYRVTFANSYGGGWIKNYYPGRDDRLLDNNRWSVRGQLLFTPTDTVSSRLIAEHYESSEYNNYYPIVRDVTAYANGGTFTSKTYTSRLAGLGYTPDFAHPEKANLDNQDRLTARTNGVSNELNWNLGDATLTSVTAWRSLRFRPHNDADGTPLAIYRSGYSVDVNQYSQELRLASAQGGAIDWQIGAYYLHEDLRSNLRTKFGQYGTGFFLSPALPANILQDAEYDRDGHLHVDSIAGFGQLTWHISPDFSITGGGRYTYEKKHVDVAGYSFGGATLSTANQAYRNALFANFGGTATGTDGTYSLSGQSNRGAVSWLVNPAWQVNENVLLYASASYGEKSGAANTAATYAQRAVIITKPEKSTDFEAGVKSTWLDGKATLNLNLYNNSIKDYQASQIDPTNASYGTYLANVGKVRLRGFELETSFRPVQAITLSANLARNDAKYLSFENAVAPIEYQNQGSTKSLTGQQVLGAPKWTVQGGVDFDQPIGDGGWAVNGYVNTSWRSSVAFVSPFSDYGWQKSYALTNVGLGIHSEDNGWQFQIWAKNVTDKRYAVLYIPASATSGVGVVYGNPRTFGGTVTKKF